MTTEKQKEEQKEPKDKTYSGFVTIVGRTNVGKSTLINALLGQKVSIVTDKAQTTTLLVKGILTEGNRQAVFVDTPGLHKPQSQYAKMFLGDIPKALEDVGLVLAVVEPGDTPEKGTKYLMSLLERVEAPKFLVVNKIDLGSKRSIGFTIDELTTLCPFEAVHKISALNNKGIDELREQIMERLAPGPFFYPEDMVSDLPQPLYVAEVVREKIMNLTSEEVPHCVGVLVDVIQEQPNGNYYIEADIFVERPSLKPIIVGKDGSMIKQIGTLARQELEEITGRKIILKTHVRVMRNWRNSEKAKKFRPE